MKMMPGVQAQIDWFMQHQDFLMNSAERAAPYLYYILQQSQKTSFARRNCFAADY